ncbi:Swi3-domain-containing protein [Lophium mytilinum]|uniref:Chromosome segregation in meiosis protein n=1 Tax=Lophium mytilinum TaxID=390894 RepID=A0A6A6RA21_9PEZI|nr:Swi3-domain-containing protein [Lophium mytilinum]
MAPQSPPVDDFDDLFLDDPAMEAAFRELDANAAAQASRRDTAGNGNAASADAAIDEEIKIVKKRQPIPKLDAPLLLSPAGIPKLRRISKDRLKFKGKGHEYSDVARLLNTYQLWLDDLYPRAKFADALTIIEKLGHSKQIQMMRKVWIEEGKPKATAESDEDIEYDLPRNQSSNQNLPEANLAAVSRDRNLGSEGAIISSERRATPERDDVPDQDELDALLAEEDAIMMEAESMSKDTPKVASRPARPMTPQDDELDALLAEEDAMTIEAVSATRTSSGMPSKAPPKLSTPQEDEFAADFAADLEAMGDMW